MANQLEQLKSETHRAETDFQNEVKYYLLNPLETPEEFHQALTGLFESVTKYHIALGKLRKYLASMRDFEKLITRQATIERAIASLNTRDAALERLLKRVSRLAADHSLRTKRTLAVPKV
jgi:hypothetical protein